MKLARKIQSSNLLVDLVKYLFIIFFYIEISFHFVECGGFSHGISNGMRYIEMPIWLSFFILFSKSTVSCFNSCLSDIGFIPYV